MKAMRSQSTSDRRMVFAGAAVARAKSIRMVR
jgi:hypothetical protein